MFSTARGEDALAADPVSAFGGIVAMNRPLDIETAIAVCLASLRTVVIAPGASDDAKNRHDGQAKFTAVD